MANVRMIQRRNGVSFAAKAFAKMLGANFDGYIPAQPRISRAIDFPHSSRAEHRRDLVGPEFSARGQAHDWPWII